MASSDSDVTPSTSSRRWLICVSLGLWLFAAWQLFLLPPVSHSFKNFGIEAPTSAALLTQIPPWVPLAIGAPLTIAALAIQSRALRRGVVVLALFAALGAHWAHAALEIKLFKVSRMGPVAAANR
jgi:hypothetical protein